jgi:hypothetical protein
MQIQATDVLSSRTSPFELTPLTDRMIAHARTGEVLTHRSSWDGRRRSGYLVSSRLASRQERSQAVHDLGRMSDEAADLVVVRARPQLVHHLLESLGEGGDLVDGCRTEARHHPSLVESTMA